MIRGLTGFIGHILVIFSMSFISLSKSAILFWTNPMILPILAICLLGENISLFDWIAIVSSLVGIILIETPLDYNEEEIISGHHVPYYVFF
jgi:drug/metabolite transporter (DMT)-like permease